MQAYGFLIISKISPSLRARFPTLRVPTFPGAELVSLRDPAGPAGRDITRHHGSGSGGLAAGMGHAWVTLDGWEGGWSWGVWGRVRRLVREREVRASPRRPRLALAAFGERQEGC